MLVKPSGIVCVFAKPPIPGQVKTRLAADIGDIAAAQLALAFFQDVWMLVRHSHDGRSIVATTESSPGFLVNNQTEIWLQGGGDLGERMQRIFERALAQAPWAIIVGSDAPTIPRSAITSAGQALFDHDAVLGPADDGGYYLIGLRRAPPDLLAKLPWSNSTTRQATHQRLTSRGLSVAEVEPGFDVDTVDDLRRLERLLVEQPTIAPASRAALDQLRSEALS